MAETNVKQIPKKVFIRFLAKFWSILENIIITLEVMFIFSFLCGILWYN